MPLPKYRRDFALVRRSCVRRNLLTFRIWRESVFVRVFVVFCLTSLPRRVLRAKQFGNTKLAAEGADGGRNEPFDEVD